MVGNSAIFLLLALFSFRADAAAATNDVCSSRTPFDAAVTTADGNTYFFRGDKYWKLKKMGAMADPPEGRSLKDDWDGLTGPIDAAFTFKTAQTKTFFFKGQNVWTYNNKKREGKENTIKNEWEDESSNMGSAKIDAAFPQDNSVYFLKGKDYYEWKNISKPPRIPAGAQKISQLVKGARGLTGDLTAALRIGNSFYFLKGPKYWKAEEGPTGSLTIAKDKEYPKEADVFVDFFGCGKAQKKGSLGLAVGIISIVLLTILALVIFFAYKQKQRQAS